MMMRTSGCQELQDDNGMLEMTRRMQRHRYDDKNDRDDEEGYGETMMMSRERYGEENMGISPLD
jgi:hypothetical protein